MSQVPILIKIPTEHLPATICSFLVKPGDKVAKSQSLLSYEYKKIIQERPVSATGDESEYVDVLAPQVEELKSPTEGELEQFHVKQGELIDKKDNKAVVGVIEPCSHSIQLHGLCALCGADITTKDYNGIEYAQRATISMAHNVAGLTVSLNEAARLEKETSSRLLEERKLSLIVDLDQTLIQATTDQTVEEWMRDENNHSAKDIHKFTLPDGPAIYYIKLRPGLKEFLMDVSKIYEPHIYTMGTRNYASAVANVIDPDNTIFNERILSRDESGSMTQKNIRRLFPCDDSMVVVIDDRADVWTWSPNLIKVHPYDFFVGIGDINDTYLPKRSIPPIPIPEIIVSEDNSKNLNNNTKEKEQVESSIVSDNNIPVNEEKEKELKEKEQNDKLNSSENSAENNIENDKETSKDANTFEEKSTREPLKVNTEDNTSTSASLLKPPAQNNKRSFEEISDDVDNADEKSAKKQQLDRNENIENKDFDQKVSFMEQRLTNISRPMFDNDTELPNLLKALEKIHKQYYEEYDRLQNISNSNGVSMTPDVTVLIPRLKRQVLKGINILFTHVIPTNQRRESADIWILAKEFGAECSVNWNKKVTHLVAGDRGTEKVKEARQKGNIFIVRKEWLDESIKKWERQPEKDYALEPASPRDSESSQISEVDKPPELFIETPSGNELTDDDDLLSPEERLEHFESTDWRSALNEVDELLAESGDTSALEESETETESNGQKRLKRHGDVLDVDVRNAKRLKQSPLRQSITFDDDENESDQGDSSLQAFSSKEKLSELGSDSFYQDSELGFDAVAHDDVDPDEIERDYGDENEAENEEENDDGYDESDDYDYDPNQSDDDDDGFDDAEYAQYFEENLETT